MHKPTLKSVGLIVGRQMLEDHKKSVQSQETSVEVDPTLTLAAVAMDSDGSWARRPHRQRGSSLDVAKLVADLPHGRPRRCEEGPAVGVERPDYAVLSMAGWRTEGLVGQEVILGRSS